MGRFGRKHDDLGRQLSAARPRPSAKLVDGIAARISARPTPRRYSRVAFGLALATFMAGLFATFGGVGYAASGVTDTVRAVKTAVHVTAKPRAVQSSAKAQYGHSQVAAAIAKVQKPKKPAPAVKTVVKSSQLPFTGLSLLPTVLVALALIGVGVLLRRREAQPQKE
jgi:hypothetical protein